MTSDPSETEPSAIVRRVGEDYVVVVGTGDVAAALGTPEAGLPAVMRRALNAALAVAPALAAGAAAIGAELVRLTPEAKALLDQYGPVGRGDGSILGVVRGADGRFAGVLGFQPAGLATRLGPSLPALLSVLAVQAQLATIERRLADLQVDVDAVIRDGQIKTMAGARAALDILEDVHGDLVETGELTTHDWERVVPLELPIRALYREASAHLQDLERMLAGSGPGLAGRIQVLRNAMRHDRAEFWLQAYVAAVAALARWDYVRLARLADQGDPKLDREAIAAEESLVRQRDLVVGLAQRLTGLLAHAGRVDGLLQRMRLVARARLERLIVDLDAVLAAYRRADVTMERPDSQAGALSGPAEDDRSLPSPTEDLTWSKIVAEVRSRPGSVARRAGRLIGIAGTAVAEGGRAVARRLPLPTESDEDGDPPA